MYIINEKRVTQIKNEREINTKEGGRGQNNS